MNDRTHLRMRELIAVTLKLLESGQITLYPASDNLRKAGVPFQVICRVLSKFSSNFLRDASVSGHLGPPSMG